MKLISKRIILLCLLVFSSLLALAEPKVYLTACVDELKTIIVDTEIDIPSSSGSCETSYWANPLKDPHYEDRSWENGYPFIEGPYGLEAVGTNENDPKLTLEWNEGWEGTVYVTIWIQKETNYLLFCAKQDHEPLVTYIITRKRINPQGSLTGEENYTVTDEGIDFSLNYEPSDSYTGELTKLGYNVLLPDGSYAFKSGIPGIPDNLFRQNISPEDPITYTSQQFGQHTFLARVTDACGDFYDIPSAVVEVEASCSGKSYSVSLSGEGIDDSPPEGYLVTKGSPITMEVTDDAGGGTDFYDHYVWGHDGGESISQSGNTFTVNADIGSFQILASFKDDRGGRENCPSIPPITVMVGGKDWIIEPDCPVDIIIPDDLYAGGAYGVELNHEDPSLQHFAAKVKGKRSIIVKPGLRLVAGAELIVEREAPAPLPDEPDLDKNFIQTTSFDEYGRVISESRQYFDAQGKLTQSQTKDLERGVVLASEIIYDIYGRAVISTLPAPISTRSNDNVTEDENGCPLETPDNFVPFAYKEGFVTDAAGNPYNFENFDDYEEFGLTKEQTPDPVGSKEEGTLGWYYSNNNGTATENEKLNEDFVATTSYPYSRTLYHHDGSGAVKGSTLPGDVFKAGGGHVAGSIDISVDTNPNVDNEDPYLKDYFKMWAEEPGLPDSGIKYEGNFLRTETEDANGNKAVVYTDKEEKTIISLYLGQEEAPITKSYTFYDAAGRAVVSVSPNGIEQYEKGVAYSQIDKTSYTYNHKNWLLEAKEPDAGISKHIYRKDGSIRFSQNAQQQTEGKYSYTNYDPSGRPIESGENKPDLSNGGIAFEDERLRSPEVLESLAANGGLDESKGIKSNRIYTFYDAPAANLPEGRKQRFVYGTVSYSKNEHITTYYSYDEIGRMEWMLQDVAGLGWKSIDYRYSSTGAVQEIAYQKGTEEQFTHFYTYDANGRLEEVKTSTEELVYNIRGELENEEVLELQASYLYYLHGPLKRVELAENLQGIDYVYTVQGWLKAMNHPESDKDPGADGTNTFAEDVFGMTLEYFSGDYVREGVVLNSLNPANAQYTGNIAATTWNSATPEAPGLSDNQAVGYQYTYDQRAQLEKAEWVLPDYANSSLTNGGAVFKVEDLNYDGNGNIGNLTRLNAEGGVMHKFKYNYLPNTNRLESVYDELNSRNHGSYAYNLIGQLKTQTSAGSSDTHYKYEVGGKLAAVIDARDNTQLSYLYDDRGFRLMKKDHASGKEAWYIRDPSGNLMSLYIKEPGRTLEQEEVPIYGSGRLGNYHPAGGDYLFEIKDHLGNVRSVVGKVEEESITDLRHYADYYPFGLHLPSRHTVGHRYGYQGEYSEDETEETGWNSFELRQYDPVVGRWNRTDPAGQYWSPYMAMGNNPANMIDPDGAYSWLGAKLRQGWASLAGRDPSSLYKQDGEWGFTSSLKGEAGIVSNFGFQSLTDKLSTSPNIERAQIWQARNNRPMHSGAIMPDYTIESFVIGGVAMRGVGLVGNWAARTSTSAARLSTNGVKLNQHLYQLEKYGSGGFKTLQNGRFRYYGKASLNRGDANSFRMVREWNPATGGKRTWFETLNPNGGVIQVRPEFGTGVKTHYLFNGSGGYLGKW